MTREELDKLAVKAGAYRREWQPANWTHDVQVAFANLVLEHAAKVAEKTQMTIYTVDDGPSVLHDAAAAIRAEKVDA